MKRMTQKLRDAMKRYYTNRAKQRSSGEEWDKQADLDNIFKYLPKSSTRCEATAGTFLIWWEDGVQTIHSESNYWKELVFTLKRKNGVWWQVRDWDGTKIKPTAV